VVKIACLPAPVVKSDQVDLAAVLQLAGSDCNIRVGSTTSFFPPQQVHTRIAQWCRLRASRRLTCLVEIEVLFMCMKKVTPLEAGPIRFASKSQHKALIPSTARTKEDRGHKPKVQVPQSKTCHGPCGLSESPEGSSMSVGFFRRDWIPRPARSSRFRKRSSLS
jgi:hypothetical protein